MIQQIEACVEKMIVLKIFDVMVSVMNVEQIHSTATFLMDRGVKFNDIAYMIRSLFYENRIKSFVEAICLQDYQLSLQDLAVEKKSGLTVLPECSYCGNGLNFYTFISKHCKHPVSIFCAVGITKQPEEFLCPRCPKQKKNSSFYSSDIVLDRILTDRLRELQGDPFKKGPQFDHMLREIEKSLKYESKEQLMTSRLSLAGSALDKLTCRMNSIYDSLY